MCMCIYLDVYVCVCVCVCVCVYIYIYRYYLKFIKRLNDLLVEVVLFYDFSIQFANQMLINNKKLKDLLLFKWH